MPKMKTNRTVYKKFRVGGKNLLKRGRANRSHNTAKRSPKRMRHLRGLVVVDKVDAPRLQRLLPYLRLSR
ncbi:MAG: 50S ribosomal protein L35 [Bdellovibrionales bacterium]|nr:50S ribosomal protein L35 [Bdellovibrionales bacterium]